MNIFKSITILIFCLLFINCGKDENSPIDESTDIFSEQTLITEVSIDGQSFNYTEEYYDFRSISQTTNVNELPQGEFSTVQFTIAIPVDNTIQLTQGSISASSTTEELDFNDLAMLSRIEGNREVFSDGIERQEYIFSFDLTQTQPRLQASNFSSFNFQLEFIYNYTSYGDPAAYDLNITYYLNAEGSEQLGGDVLFWSALGNSCGNIEVTISGISPFTIPANTTGGEPSCDNIGIPGKLENLPAGTYSYTATCSNQDWSGTFNITDGNCTIIELENEIARSDIQFYYSGFEYPDSLCEDFGMRVILNKASNNQFVSDSQIFDLYGNVSPTNCYDNFVGGLLEDIQPGEYYARLVCGSGTTIITTSVFTLEPGICLIFDLKQ